MLESENVSKYFVTGFLVILISVYFKNAWKLQKYSYFGKKKARSFFINAALLQFDWMLVPNL